MSIESINSFNAFPFYIICFEKLWKGIIVKIVSCIVPFHSTEVTFLYHNFFTAAQGQTVEFNAGKKI